MLHLRLHCCDSCVYINDDGGDDDDDADGDDGNSVIGTGPSDGQDGRESTPPHRGAYGRGGRGAAPDRRCPLPPADSTYFRRARAGVSPLPRRRECPDPWSPLRPPPDRCVHVLSGTAPGRGRGRGRCGASEQDGARLVKGR
jgi:hypothetical protein